MRAVEIEQAAQRRRPEFASPTLRTDADQASFVLKAAEMFRWGCTHSPLNKPWECEPCTQTFLAEVAVAVDGFGQPPSLGDPEL